MVNEMNLSDSYLFNWLVRYHTEKNLQPNLSSYSLEEVLQEGEENERTQGCLILANGEKLRDRLLKEYIILDRSSPRFEEADSYHSFSRFLTERRRKDGAFIYDGKNKMMARVSTLKNSSPAMGEAREKRLSLIPKDFFFYRSTKTTEDDIEEYLGTKTDLALVLPVAYSIPGSRVETFQIKKSKYGNTNLGKVTHFGPEGLIEEFFFMHEPKSDDIVGIYRKYERQREEVVKVAEKRVSGFKYQPREERQAA